MRVEVILRMAQDTDQKININGYCQYGGIKIYMLSVRNPRLSTDSQVTTFEGSGSLLELEAAKGRGGKNMGNARLTGGRTPCSGSAGRSRIGSGSVRDRPH